MPARAGILSYDVIGMAMTGGQPNLTGDGTVRLPQQHLLAAEHP
jgi:hypothetical protein